MRLFRSSAARVRFQQRAGAFAGAAALATTLAACGEEATVPLCLGDGLKVTPAGAPLFPTEFEMTESLMSWGTSFNVTSAREDYGDIEEKLLSLGRTFEYRDDCGNLIATARAKPFSWGVEIDVLDHGGAPIGTIKENVWQSWGSYSSEYSILDASGHEIAKSRKLEWGDTTFTLTVQDKVVATIERPWNRITDTWDVTLGPAFDESKIDSRLLLMIGAYKTAADNDREQEMRDATRTTLMTAWSGEAAADELRERYALPK